MPFENLSRKIIYVTCVTDDFLDPISSIFESAAVLEDNSEIVKFAMNYISN